MFPIHWLICGGPPQYQNWPPQIDFPKALISLNKHEHCTFKNQNPAWVFLYHCISEGIRLSSENFQCHFHFILHVMPDKAAFVSGALLCVQRYQGNLYFSHSKSASCWQRMNLHNIYMGPGGLPPQIECKAVGNTDLHLFQTEIANCLKMNEFFTKNHCQCKHHLKQKCNSSNHPKQPSNHMGTWKTTATIVN